MKLIFNFSIFVFILLSIDSIAKEKIVIWTSNENVKKAIDTVALDFSKDFEVDVDAVVLNKDLTSQFKTAAISGKGPDILVWAHDVIGELAESGLIEPITMPNKLKISFIPVTLDAFRYKGKYYGYPYALEAIAFFYNKKFIENPPKTMDEVIEISKKINDGKKYGFLYDPSDFFFSFPLLSAAGGYIFKSNDGTLDVNDIGLNNEGALIGAKLIRRFIKEGVIPESTDRNISSNKMKSNELVMTIDGPWAVLDLEKSGIDFGVSPIPTINGMPARPFVGVHGFIVRRSSKNKDLAKTLIENYLVSKSGILGLYKMDPRCPSREDAINELVNEKYVKNFLNSASSGIPMPNIPQMGAVWGSMKSALMQIIAGKRSEKDALDEAVDQIKTSIGKK